MSPHGNRSEDAGSSLPSLVAQLRNRCKAITRLQGGHPDHAEEVAIFRELASDAGHFLDEAPPELSTPPWDEGNEHQVWFQPESATYLKATWPDHFGMLVIHRLNEEPSASPIDYLERWMWHNRLFGDTVEFIGALDTDSSPLALGPDMMWHVSPVLQAHRSSRRKGAVGLDQESSAPTPGSGFPAR